MQPKTVAERKICMLTLEGILWERIIKYYTEHKKLPTLKMTNSQCDWLEKLYPKWLTHKTSKLKNGANFNYDYRFFDCEIMITDKSDEDIKNSDISICLVE
jgi:hypothetical protein